jgi:hypothetical protein
MTHRTGGGYRHRARSFHGAEVFGCAGDVGQLTAITQASNQESVFLTEEEGRTIECTENKDFGASRKNLINLRAKRNHLPPLWTRSFSLLPL